MSLLKKQCPNCNKKQYEHTEVFCSRDTTRLIWDFDSLLNQKINESYIIQSKIGQGAIGIVFKANDLKCNRTVAIKLLHPDISETDTIKRFEREATVLKVLDHPNIMKTYDTEKIDGYPFIVSEFLEGEDLKILLSKKGKFPLGEAFNLIKPVGAALHYTHQQGSLHRDIKPENILIQNYGKPNQVIKLIDFGLVKSGLFTTQLTKSGTFLGTVIYMSPEQCQADPLDSRADLYSLATVFYQLLIGKPPVTRSRNSEGLQALALKQILDQPEELCLVDPNIPTDVSEVVKKALSKKKEDRQNSVEEFIDELQKAIGIQPTPQPSTQIVSQIPSTQVITNPVIHNTTKSPVPAVVMPISLGITIFFGLVTLLFWLYSLDSSEPFPSPTPTASPTPKNDNDSVEKSVEIFYNQGLQHYQRQQILYNPNELNEKQKELDQAIQAFNRVLELCKDNQQFILEYKSMSLFYLVDCYLELSTPNCDQANKLIVLLLNAPHIDKKSVDRLQNKIEKVKCPKET